MNAHELKLEIDQASLRETLALVERIEAAATRAKAAIASLGVAQTPDFVVGEFIADETQELILAELRGLRAETKALRADAARVARNADRCLSGGLVAVGSGGPDFEPVLRAASFGDAAAPLFPPEGAKHGFWRTLIGSALPVWTESLPPTRMQEPESR